MCKFAHRFRLSNASAVRTKYRVRPHLARSRIQMVGCMKQSGNDLGLSPSMWVCALADVTCSIGYLSSLALLPRDLHI